MKKSFYIIILFLLSLNIGYSQYSIGVKKDSNLLTLRTDGRYVVNHCMHNANDVVNLSLDLVVLQAGIEISTTENFSIVAYENSEGNPQYQNTELPPAIYSISANNNLLFSFDSSSNNFPNCLPNPERPFRYNMSTFQIDITLSNGTKLPSQLLTIVLTTTKGFVDVVGNYGPFRRCENSNSFNILRKIKAKYLDNLGILTDYDNFNYNIIIRDTINDNIVQNPQNGYTYTFAPSNGLPNSSSTCEAGTISKTISFDVTYISSGDNYFGSNNLSDLFSNDSFYSVFNNTRVYICEDDTNNSISFNEFNIELNEMVVSAPHFLITFGQDDIDGYNFAYDSTTNTVTFSNLSIIKKRGGLRIKLIDYKDSDDNVVIVDDIDCRGQDVIQINVYVRGFQVKNKVKNYIIQQNFPSPYMLSSQGIYRLITDTYGINEDYFSLSLYSSPYESEIIPPNDILLTNWVDDVLNPIEGGSCNNQKIFYCKIIKNCNNETLPTDEGSGYAEFTINLFDISPLYLENSNELYLCNEDGTNTFTLNEVQSSLILRYSETINNMVFYDSEYSMNELDKEVLQNFTVTSTGEGNVFYVANVGYLPALVFCGTYPLINGEPLQTISSRRIKITVYNDCCPEPDNLTITETDTTAYLRWDNLDTPPRPVGGWEIHYFFGNLDIYPTNPETGEPVSPLEVITVHAPDKLIENLVPGNAYTFFVKSICGDGKESGWVYTDVSTLCSGCNTFTPVPGKEYVVSAWVKEDWEKTWEVNLAGPNPNTNIGYIRSMLNMLTERYKNNVNTNIPICPNGTVVDGLTTLRSLIGNDNNIFNQNLLDEAYSTNDSGTSDGKPAIYNFRYNEEINKFQFQFVKGEYVETNNLIQNPGAENGTNFWSGSNLTAVNRFTHTGFYSFWSNVESYHQSYTDISFQDVNVNEYSVSIDNGDAKVDIAGYRLTSSDNCYDRGKIKIEFFNEQNGILDNIEEGEAIPLITWTPTGVDNFPIPPYTRKIRYSLISEKNTCGTTIDAWFDDIYLAISYYKDNENFPIQTYDVDCYENGTYNFIELRDVIGNGDFGVEDATNHYPDLKPFFNLKYDCNGYVEENKYNYGKNTFRLVETAIPTNPDLTQKFEYNNSKIELIFIDDKNEKVSDNIAFLPTGDIIDGWQRIEGVFQIPENTIKIKIDLVNNLTDRDNYFDDIRIFPKDGNIKSFVYDPITQKLMAELDENNYATFYEYDNEGGLIRVKKETEKGVFTIQETRSGNVKK